MARTVISTADLPIYYSSDYTLAGHAFDTTRKSAWVADSLRRQPIENVRIVEPEPLTAEQVAQVHDPAYVEAVRTGQPRALAESQGFEWDPGLWQMVLASNGGAVAAALAALRTKSTAGSLSSGLHHAKRERGDGFCTFNGLALAARAAQRAGARRILILDFDAHCGGGTAQLLGDDPSVRQVDVAVSSYDTYSPPDGWTLDLISNAADYVPTILRRLNAIQAKGAEFDTEFDLVLYNAGMDPSERSAVGGLDGVTTEMLRRRERIVFDWCRWQLRAPVAFVLAGGYAYGGEGQAELTELHRSTVEAAMQAATSAKPMRVETCPNCRQPIEPVPIVYGYPTWETGEAGRRGELVLGGCEVYARQPEWACPSCRESLSGYTKALT